MHALTTAAARSAVLVAALVVTTVSALPNARGADEPVVISADEARNYVGKKVTAKMTVMAAKHSVKRKTVFLDSQPDFNDPKNLGLTLDEAAQQKFTAAGVAEPHVFYKDKAIRVTGTPFLQDDRVYIKVDEPSQITVD